MRSFALVTHRSVALQACASSSTFASLSSLAFASLHNFACARLCACSRLPGGPSACGVCFLRACLVLPCEPLRAWAELSLCEHLAHTLPVRASRLYSGTLRACGSLAFAVLPLRASAALPLRACIGLPCELCEPLRLHRVALRPCVASLFARLRRFAFCAPA